MFSIASPPLVNELLDYLLLTLENVERDKLCKGTVSLPRRKKKHTKEGKERENTHAHKSYTIFVFWLYFLRACTWLCVISVILSSEWIWEFAKEQKNEESRDATKCPTMNTARSEEWEPRKVFCSSWKPKEFLCYFMCNERHVLLRASDEFQIRLKISE